MEYIHGWEWVLIGISLGTAFLCVVGILYVDGDIGVEVAGTNDDEQAASMFMDLLRKTERTIDIHDDGNNSESSMYNNQEVVNTVQDCLERGVTIRCLFNDNEPLKLRELAESGDYGDHFQIWYLTGGRQDPDTHYKIVDDGCYVHLSKHGHGDEEREYRLRTAVGWWKGGTRKRIRKRFAEHFESGLKVSERAV